jgi:hypothetical protein
VTFRNREYPNGARGHQLRLMQRGPIDDDVHDAWPLVVRVAVVVSLLAAAAGGTLYRFAGVSPVALVVATAVFGLAVGWRLPAVHPRARPLPLHVRRLFGADSLGSED